MPFALLRRPDPDHLDIVHAGETYRVAVRRRPTARRLTLRVSAATGEVVITLPARSAIATAQRFAVSHGGWIAARLARVPERVPLAEGATVPLRGVPHRIVRRGSRSGITRIESDGAAPAISVSCGAEHVARRVRGLPRAGGARRPRRRGGALYRQARPGARADHGARHPQPLGLLHRRRRPELLLAPDPRAALRALTTSSPTRWRTCAR